MFLISGDPLLGSASGANGARSTYGAVPSAATADSHDASAVRPVACPTNIWGSIALIRTEASFRRNAYSLALGSGVVASTW